MRFRVRFFKGFTTERKMNTVLCREHIREQCFPLLLQVMFMVLFETTGNILNPDTRFASLTSAVHAMVQMHP